MDDEALKKLYEDLGDVLDISSGWLYDDLLRNIGWGIIQLLVWINDWIEGVATQIISLGGLYDNSDMNGFIDILQPLAIGLFVVSITVLGFMFMLNKVEKRNEIVSFLSTDKDKTNQAVNNLKELIFETEAL